MQWLRAFTCKFTMYGIPGVGCELSGGDAMNAGMHGVCQITTPYINGLIPSREAADGQAEP